MLQTQKCYKHF